MSFTSSHPLFPVLFSALLISGFSTHRARGSGPPRWSLDRSSDQVSLLVAEGHSDLALLGRQRWRQQLVTILMGDLQGSYRHAELVGSGLFSRPSLGRWSALRALSISCPTELPSPVMSGALGVYGELLHVDLLGLLERRWQTVDVETERHAQGRLSARAGRARGAPAVTLELPFDGRPDRRAEGGLPAPPLLQRLLRLAREQPFELIRFDLRGGRERERSPREEEPCMISLSLARHLLRGGGEMICESAAPIDSQQRSARAFGRSFERPLLEPLPLGALRWWGRGLRAHIRDRSAPPVGFAVGVLTALLAGCGALEELEYQPRPSLEGFATIREKLQPLGCAEAGCHQAAMGGVELTLRGRDISAIEADYLSLRPFLLSEEPAESPLLRRLSPPGSGHPICFEPSQCLYQEIEAWLRDAPAPEEGSCEALPEGWRCQDTGD